MSPRARVITVSTRAAAGKYADTAGPIAAAALRQLGLDVDPIVLVPDGEPVEQALRDALAEGIDCIITAGGTGLSPDDRTPQITSRLIDYEIPGLADLIRARAWDRIPTASISRGIAGVADASLIVNLPGSAGAVGDGIAVLAELLPHVLDQLAGGDHKPHVNAAHSHDDHPAHVHASHDHDDPDPNARGVVVLATVTDQLITVADHERLVVGPDRGAVVSFAGVVRDHDHGRIVKELEYVGHPSAAELIQAVARDAAARPGVAAVAVTHRVGIVAIGETALACAVSAAHRRAAFETCGWLVDEVKRQLPVWKRQEFADGTHEWVNCP